MLAYLAGLNLLLGLGMALGRGSSDALFLKRFGVEYLPHMLFLTSLLLAVSSMGYAAIVDRLRPAKLFNILFVAFCVYLAAVWAAMRMSDSVAAFALYFIGYGVISEILVVHFNFYALSFFDTLQAKRLFSVVSAAARFGAVLGGVALGLGSVNLRPEDVALVWVATLGLVLWLINRRHRQEPSLPIAARKPHKQPWDDIREGLQFARSSPLLRISALGMFIMILVISIQDYLVSTVLSRHFSDAQSLTAFFGWFLAVTNGIVLILQLFVTNRLLRRFGLKTVNLIFPLTSVFSLAALTFASGFAAALFTRFNYLGLLPAFRIPAANLFYNALPGYMQGRARALLVGLVLPAGLGCSGLLLMLVPPAAVDERLAAFGLFLALIYLWLKVKKNRLYGESLLEVLQQQVFSGWPAELDGNGLLTPKVIDSIKKLARENSGRESSANEVLLAIAKLLAENATRKTGPLLLEIAPDTQVSTQNQLLPLLAKLRPVGWEKYARACLSHDDHHLRATALQVLTAVNLPGIWPVIESWLVSSSPRLKATATHLALQSSDVTLQAQARACLEVLLASAHPGYLIAAIGVMELNPSPEHLARLMQLTQAEDIRVRSVALRVLGLLAPKSGINLGQRLVELARDPSPRIRSTALTALPAASDAKLRLSLLATALDDHNHAVRASANKVAAAALPADSEVCRAALSQYFSHFDMQALLCRALASAEIPDWRVLLQENAVQHVNAARGKHALLLSLGENPIDSPPRMLATVLREEVQQHISHVLEIMVLLDESTASRIIQSALSSRNRHLRAQALESVRQFEHAALFENLLPILEEEPDAAMETDLAYWAAQSWTEVLAWCRREGSLWLVQCAEMLPTVLPSSASGTEKV